MTQSKAPPPIKPLENRPHEKWGDISKLLKKAHDTPPPGMSDLRLQFLDEFAPSHAQAFSSDPQALSNPAARHLFYNQHLYELLITAVDGAINLGLPHIYIGFPLTFDRVTDETFSVILRTANALSPFLQEGSPSWLCVQIYLRHAQICNQLDNPIWRQVTPLPGECEEDLAFRQRGCDAMLLINFAFFLGAATRELELAMLNRADAIRGKKTKRAAKAGGDMRKNKTLPETDARRAEMLRLTEAGHTVANAARLTRKTVGGSVEANRALLKPSRKK